MGPRGPEKQTLSEHSWSLQPNTGHSEEVNDGRTKCHFIRAGAKKRRWTELGGYQGLAGGLP